MLFRDFDELSKEVTRHYYREVLGEAAERASIDANESLTAADSELREARKSGFRFLGGFLTMLRPPWLVAWEGAGPDAAALRERRDAMERLLPEMRRTAAQLGESDGKRRSARGAEALLESGFSKLKNEDFGLSRGTVDEAEQVAESEARESAALGEMLGRLNHETGLSLSGALQLA